MPCPLSTQCYWTIYGNHSNEEYTIIPYHTSNTASLHRLPPVWYIVFWYSCVAGLTANSLSTPGCWRHRFLDLSTELSTSLAYGVGALLSGGCQCCVLLSASKVMEGLFSPCLVMESADQRRRRRRFYRTYVYSKHAHLAGADVFRGGTLGCTFYPSGCMLSPQSDRDKLL